MPAQTTKGSRAWAITLCFATVSTAATGNPAHNRTEQMHARDAAAASDKSFSLPGPDAILSVETPIKQSNYCGDLVGGVASDAATAFAQIAAVVAVFGWCGVTGAGAREMTRGDLEQGLSLTAMGALLGGLVGWGAGYGLAVQNQVPQNERTIWELGGASIGAGSSIAVGLGALGIRMLLGPPEPADPGPSKRNRRQRPRPRSR